ncbi:MAG: hypothetical protein EPO39_00630 [Candidatus Manganitrophaceae bacterium]|nr:MAG: hypothetical protein EPO39_00630 [Candidatus Manganitrophaceae bacterium]
MKTRDTLRKRDAGLMIWRALLLGVVLFSAPLPASAQLRDVVAPRLDYTPPFPITMVQEIEMSAVVTDEGGVRSVRLFYRKKGEQQYKSLLLEKKRGDEKRGVYALSIPRLEVGPEGLEYYLVAEDGSGNQRVKGEALHPMYMRALLARPTLKEAHRRFEWLKQAWEAKDLAEMRALSELPKSREAFLRQMFENYRSIALEMTVEEAEPVASARFTIKGLVDADGNSVVPGAAWSTARVRLPFPRDENETWGKIIWE